jgi:hypothetical protein
VEIFRVKLILEIRNMYAGDVRRVVDCSQQKEVNQGCSVSAAPWTNAKHVAAHERVIQVRVSVLWWR